MMHRRGVLIGAFLVLLFVAATALRIAVDTSEDERPARHRPAVATGAVFRPVAAGAVSFDTDGCDPCGVIDDGMAWEVDGRTARVLRREGDELWRPVLVAADPDGSRFSSVRARAEDLTGDGTPEVVFGFRGLGTGGILQVDVVAAPGDVVLHRDLDKGGAVVRDGQLQTWSAQFAPDDANCCPSTFLHTTIVYEDGRWREAERKTVSQPAAGPGQL